MVPAETKRLFFWICAMGAVLAAALVRRPTFRHLNAQRADIVTCANVPDRDLKSRFGIYQRPDGERVRAYQCRSIEVTPPLSHSSSWSDAACCVQLPYVMMRRLFGAVS